MSPSYSIVLVSVLYSFSVAPTHIVQLSLENLWAAWKRETKIRCPFERMGGTIKIYDRAGFTLN